MKTFSRSENNGSALVVTLLVIFLITACIGTAVHTTSTTVKQTSNSRDFSSLRFACEGALEFAFGVWLKKVNPSSFNYVAVKNADLDSALNGPIPSFKVYNSLDNNGPVFQYDNARGYSRPKITAIDLGNNAQPTPAPVATKVYLENYPAWYGTKVSYLASVCMKTPAGRTPVLTYGVKRAMSYTTIPLFQAMAFFEDNLELYRPAPMTIDGLVHTNGTLSVSQGAAGGNSNSALTFTGNVSYVLDYVDNTAPYPADDPTWRASHSPTADWWSGYVANSAFSPNYTDGGFDLQANQVRRMEPLGVDASGKDSNNNQILSPNTSELFRQYGNNFHTRSDFNPNTNSAREIIEPPDTYVKWQSTSPYETIVTKTGSTDPQAIKERRIYNQAGLIIEVSGSTYTITAANGTKLGANSTQQTKTINAIKTGLTQQTGTTFYDTREGKNTTVTTLDMSKVLKTLNKVQGDSTGYLSGFNGILYIYDKGTTGASPRTFRLINGTTLPSAGLTVGSLNPVYIQGDYNNPSTGSRVPSAVFADAVTILSNSWSDSNSSKALTSRTASETTVNTAIVTGQVPSVWTNPTTNSTYGYSGGLNNFPRFLENWTGKKFNYTGSMIELFSSQISIGEWDTGAIYNPPNRNWAFDTNFITNPPPGQLTATVVNRGEFTRF